MFEKFLSAFATIGNLAEDGAGKLLELYKNGIGKWLSLYRKPYEAILRVCKKIYQDGGSSAASFMRKLFQNPDCQIVVIILLWFCFVLAFGSLLDLFREPNRRKIKEKISQSVKQANPVLIRVLLVVVSVVLAVEAYDHPWVMLIAMPYSFVTGMYIIFGSYTTQKQGHECTENPKKETQAKLLVFAETKQKEPEQPEKLEKTEKSTELIEPSNLTDVSSKADDYSGNKVKQKKKPRIQKVRTQKASVKIQYESYKGTEIDINIHIR